MGRFAIGALITLAFVECVAGDSVLEPVDSVDPFIGCSWNGHTYPGAACPFGLVQPGPDTGVGDWAHCSGYVYADKTIYGFSQTHLSGTGCPDLADVRLLPFTGAAPSNGDEAVELCGLKDSGSETATPGYYAVTLTNFGIRAEVTAAKRVAFHRWTNQGDGRLQVLLDPQWGEVWTKRHLATHLLSWSGRAEADGCTFVGGFRHRGWLAREVHYRVAFSRPYRSIRTLPRRKGEQADRQIMEFDIGKGETLEAVVAIATTDDAGAARNFTAESELGFDGARSRARAEWNDLLSRVEVSGADREKRVNFYTALYHLFLQPNDITDADGRYRGADGVIEQSPAGHPLYSGFSLWDTFRAAHPLYTIVVPERVNDFIQSLLAQYRAVKFLPVWTAFGSETYCMVGNHAVPVIVDAYMKGFRGFDAQEALDAVVGSLTKTHPVPGGGMKLDEDWSMLDRFGYYPSDLVNPAAVSRTLECAYDDACAARLASALGDHRHEEFFRRRSGNWRNVLDVDSGFARGKTVKGEWVEPFDPFRFGGDYTEGNAWQYTWHVMHDPFGLIAALGGEARFAERLDRLFAQPESIVGSATVRDTTGFIGQYVHGNEQSHHIAYFYPLVGRSYRTAEIVREVIGRYYHPRPDGLCGNEDCGQMSAWYVFSSLGLYPFDPCGGEYVIGAPQVPRAEIRIKAGNGQWTSFVVVAKGLSVENKYVKSVTLNRKPVEGWKILHADVMQGGELVFEMTDRQGESRK